MKISKIISAAAALSLAAVSLTACGGNNSEPPTAVTTEASVSETPDNTGSDTEANNTETVTDSESGSAPVFESGAAKVTVDGTKFTVDGKELWINGVNTPWDKWNDFGNKDFDPEFWDSHFAELEAAGINASRVWINCSGMNAVRLKSTGEVKEVSEKHWEDLDKLFQIAEKHKIYIMATLLSFDHFKETNGGSENWRNMITTDEGIASYVNDYVIPFVKRYDGCDYLWSIDLCNEPDWIHENDENGKLGWEDICNYFADAAAAIHENSDILVTVGMGMIKYNSDDYDGNFVSDEFLKSLGNENSYLDFYSTHYYFWQNGYMGFPFEVSPEGFKLEYDRPCVIGEAAADSSESGRTLTEEYEGAYTNGWNGVMAWTSNGVDDCGDLGDIKPAAARIAELAPEKVHPLG